MKRHKGLGLSRACGHGQHALDEHDRDTLRVEPVRREVCRRVRVPYERVQARECPVFTRFSSRF